MNLFLAPHPDDETLFGAYTLMREKPLVVVVTDGYQHHRRFGVPIKQRRDESIAACTLLGVEVEFLGLSDEDLKEEELISALNGLTADTIYVPALEGGNKDHDLVHKVAVNKWGPKVVYYSTYTKKDLTPNGKIEVIPTEEEKELKRLALSCYESQIKLNWAHFDAVRDKSEYLNI
jgi:LmbE family N-acetylglucosaminyl deacetylase